MTAAEWGVGIISFFPSARMQRSDLGSDCHSHYEYKPELDTLHPRIEDEVRLPTLSAELLLCRKADQVFTAVASKALWSGVRLQVLAPRADASLSDIHHGT
jgi:hypothetical protein